MAKSTTRFTDPKFTGPIITGSLPQITMEVFTPATAWEAYGTRLTGHRSFNDLTVHQISDAAIEGNWQPGEAVRFNKAGNLVDGGSIMYAISTMPQGSELFVPVQRHMPDDWSPSEDVIKSKRHWGHSLAYIYQNSNSTNLRVAASIANMLYGYDGPGSLPDFRRKLWTWREMLGFFEPIDSSLIRAASLGQSLSTSDQKNTPGAITTPETLGMVFWLLQDEPTAPAFFADMCRRATHVVTNPADPRSQFINHFRRPINDLGIHRYRNSYLIRVRRVADLLGLWDAHTNKTAWTPWNGMEPDFKHPVLSASNKKHLGWA